MSRLFSAGAVLSALTAFASAGAKQNLDVFLSSPQRHALTDARALPAATREMVRAGRISQTEPRLGVPSFFWAARDPAFHSLRDQGVTPEQAARRYLFSFAPLYRVDPKATAERATARVHDTGEGAVIVSFALPEHGKRVIGEELKVIMDQRLQLVALSGWLSPLRKEEGSFRLTEQTAIAQAYLDLAGEGLEANRISRLAPTAAEGAYRHFAIAGETHPARTRPVYFATADGLAPGWYVELHLPDLEGTSSRYFSYVVSASDGRLLLRHDLTRYDGFGYRVWADTSGLMAPLDGPQGNAPSPHPTGTPNQLRPALRRPQPDHPAERADQHQRPLAGRGRHPDAGQQRRRLRRPGRPRRLLHRRPRRPPPPPPASSTAPTTSTLARRQRRPAARPPSPSSSTT